MNTQALGIFLLAAGLVLLFRGSLPWLCNLPGDISHQFKNGTTVFFPITTCILISIVISILVKVFGRK